jgi:hypothetical protein
MGEDDWLEAAYEDANGGEPDDAQDDNLDLLDHEEDE